LEEGAAVEGGWLTRCLVLERSRLSLSRARLVDSVVGPSAFVQLGAGDYSLVVGERSRVVALR